MEIEKTLQVGIAEGLSKLYKLEIQALDIKLQPTRKEFDGSHTFTCFQYAKPAGQSPEDLGNALGAYLLENVIDVKSFNVVKGFLNIVLKDDFLISFLNTVTSNPNYGQLAPKSQTVMVEYSSPNTNKPLHLGHLRNNFLGYSVAEVLRASGYDVIKANLVNDRGIHICKSMLAYTKYGNNETPESAGIKGDHLIGKYYVKFDVELKAEVAKLKEKGWTDDDIEKKNPLMIEAQQMLLKWEAGDKTTVDLWKKMNGWVYEGFNYTYKKIGVDFDKMYYESDTYLLGKEVVEEGIQKKVFYKRPDGSVWIDLTQDGLDEKLVLRADGTSVYITQDIGTADLKYKDFKLDKSVYVVGNEQDYHFNVLKLIMKKLGRPYADGIYHLSYGMVDLPSGKMKSREGTVVDADDLVQEMLNEAEKQTRELGKIDDFSSVEAKMLYSTIGLGALKYYLIKVDPKKRMMFNPTESIDFHGNTGPFIQYTYARIASILRKGKTIGIDSYQLSTINYQLQGCERETIVHLLDFENKLNQSANEYAPSIIANYVYDLAKLFNSFYAEVSIFQESNPEVVKFRIAFCFVVSQTIKTCTKLLGINVPERM
jgi:arginyl-tRNA synthetase